jgi:G3E family GTPase
MLRATQSAAGVLSASGGIPLTIVAGESGAGKSTLLARLMSAPSTPRVAALMSAASVRALEPLSPIRVDGDTVRLRGGALCCGLEGDFVHSLSRLNEGPERPDHVFMEVATIAELRRARGYFYMPGYRPCGIVMVVGANSVARGIRDDLPDRLDDASLIVMNKVDTIDEDVAAKAEVWLRRSLARMPILCVRNGDVAPQLLLGFDRATPGSEISVAAARWSPDLEIRVEDLDRRRRPTMRLGDCCRAWSLDTSDLVDQITFRRWVDRLPTTVVRGHGVVMTRSEPHIRYRFELLGAHSSLQRDGLWRDEEPRTQITLVGLADEAPRSNGVPVNT